MQMKLVRKLGNAGFTEGRLYIDGVFECFTVEDADRHLEKGGVKIQNQTAIPKGIYEVVITMSNRFRKLMPLLKNVPGFSGVRIHSGNKSADTEGCIIVGAVNGSMDDDFIGSSKVAMERLYPKISSALNAGQKVTLEIV
jgi:hypothetical protein